MREKLQQNFGDHLSLRHYRKSITKEIEEQTLQSFQSSQTNVDLNRDKLYNTDMKLTLAVIEAFYLIATGRQFDV